MNFVECTQEEFDFFSRNSEYSNFWQTAQMGDYKQKQGCKVFYVGVVDNDKIIAASCIIGYKSFANYYIFHAPRGFIIDYKNLELLKFFVRELKEFLKKHRGLYLHFNPYLKLNERNKEAQLIEDGENNYDVVQTLIDLGCKHQGFTKGFDVTTEPRWMMVLDLKDKDAQTVLKEMDQQTRWSVNRSLKYPIHVQTLEKKDFILFKDLLDRTAQRRGFESYPLEYFENMYDAFGDEVVEIVLANLQLPQLKESLHTEKEQYQTERLEVLNKLEELPNSKKFTKKLRVLDEAIDLINKKLKEAEDIQEKHGDTVILAGAMFIWQKNEVIYLYSASDDSFKKFMAPYSIQWKQIRKAIQNHIPRYNFYGTSGIFDKNADDYGVYEFKKGFNSHVEELIGDFDLVVNQSMYFIYSKLKMIQSCLRKD